LGPTADIKTSYDDDEPAPPPAKEEQAEPEPEPSYPAAQPTDAYSSAQQHSAADSMMNDAGGQGFGDGNSYGGDGDMGYGAPEESHEPVGMKEDG
jgi:hypothetical protein